MTQEIRLSLAPIRGLTTASFRSLFCKHFAGFNSSIAPFINPQKRASFDNKMLKDVLPEANMVVPVIPQLLHNNAEDFIALAGRLAELGYKEINWNLGCPAPMVAKKKRGSGMLAHPDLIVEFLEEVLPQIPVKLSIKTRLGYSNTAQTKELLPRLDQFPLTEIIIHARLGKQMYKGTTDPDTFAECLQLSQHRIAYNGDITTLEHFHELQTRFPQVEHWMIGRGALADPFLAERIKGIGKLTPTQELLRLEKFHAELFEIYREELSGPSHIVGRMKMLWQYLGASFPKQKKLLKKVHKAYNEEQFQESVSQLFQAERD
ncbi:tRNA-dihydrouridine synthase family protein [Desulfotalea psychrophila]|uniref:tRNA-dihydrouridine synthase n=1 Tax=Desulfotalea psychrophila (strain LSv54 / DSM 12343) TaxID=177439 RepID=Q6AJ40_DESPS|nr:tRNA-dihydrouridine synthase family protein [Desulfotalea psychrophila]CAG37640.1 conserved hypothetical protein [Desulfotalea psychrophila LSv54]